jgi:hypothetical protein
VRNCVILSIVTVLVACGGPPQRTTAQQAKPAVAATATTTTEPAVENIVPVELGRRRPNTPMTSSNMPFYDTVTWCLLKTRKTDTKVKGPAYEACLDDQDHTRILLADGIDAGQFQEADIVRCAKASRTAYQCLWYCLNGQAY